MKKILGILGVTLIMAVSFFNMSSVVDAKQNVNLASILQSASAQNEGSGGNSYSKIPYDKIDDYDSTTYSNGREVRCHQKIQTWGINCDGYGLIDCEEEHDFKMLEDTCKS